MRKAVLVSTQLVVRIDISLQNPEAQRPGRTTYTSRFEGGAKSYLETGILFCQKTIVCKTTDTGHIAASKTNCMSVPRKGGGGTYQRFFGGKI